MARLGRCDGRKVERLGKISHLLSGIIVHKTKQIYLYSSVVLYIYKTLGTIVCLAASFLRFALTVFYILGKCQSHGKNWAKRLRYVIL